MHLSQAQAVNAPALVGKSEIGRLPALSRFRVHFAAMLRRFTRPQHDIDLPLAGHAWCDSLEHQVNFDIASCRRTWLF